MKIAGPTAAGIVFGIRIEQRRLATRAVVNAWHFTVVILATESPLGAAQPTNLKLLIGKRFTPGFQRFFQLVHSRPPQDKKGPD
jgi:hypothetical protein